MKNASHFQLTSAEAGVDREDSPALFRLRQKFPRPQETDVAAATQRELQLLLEPQKQSLKGASIAISGSSRGISNLDTVVRECASALRAAGAEPFVVPGMGSHGGATAKGQAGVLHDINNISEQTVGCPVRASMDTVKIGVTKSGFAVHQDKLCHDADGVLVVNRVKPHTGFTEVVESGLCKMLVIGLGKQIGASRIHQQAIRIPMGELILDASKIIVQSERPRLIGGIAVVENAFKETAQIKAAPMHSHTALLDTESELLKHAYALLPRLPFEDIDALIVNEMGKNISGSGMDSNVIGKKQGLTKPQIGAIYVRGLTEQTHGNSVGIGFADVMPRKMLEHIDLNATYMNAFTAKRPAVAKLPMLAETELQAMQILMNFRAEEEPDSLRLLWIENTSKLNEMWASAALLAQARDMDSIEILSDPVRMTYDADLNLLSPA